MTVETETTLSWENHTNAFVFKDVLLNDGKLYDVQVEKPGTKIPKGFAILRDDVLEIHSLLKNQIFPKIQVPSQSAIVHSARQKACQVYFIASNQVSAGDKGMAAGVKRINEIVSPRFKVIAASSPLEMLPASRIVNLPFVPMQEASGNDEDLGLSPVPLPMDLDETPAGPNQSSALPVPLPEEASSDDESESPVPLSRGPNKASARAKQLPALPVLPSQVSLLDDSDDDADSESDENMNVQVSAAKPPEQVDEQLLSLLDGVKLEPKYSRLCAYASGENQDPDLGPFYETFTRVLQNPKEPRDENKKVKEWLNKLIKEAYDKYFKLGKDKDRSEAAARWVIAPLVHVPMAMDSLVDEMTKIEPLSLPEEGLIHFLQRLILDK